MDKDAQNRSSPMTALMNEKAIPAWQPVTLEELHAKQSHRSAFIFGRIREAESRLSERELANICSLTLQVQTRDHAALEYEKLYGPVDLKM